MVRVSGLRSTADTANATPSEPLNAAPFARARSERSRDGIGNAVVDVNELHGEGSKLVTLGGPDLVIDDAIAKSVLCKLHIDEAEG